MPNRVSLKTPASQLRLALAACQQARCPQWLGALCAAALLIAGSPAAAGDRAGATPAPTVIDLPHPVRAPWYGVALFDFYGGKYFSAIADLLVAEHFSRLGDHDEEGRILRGVVLLSYGLDAEAQAIFQGLIGNHASPSAQARAWYYLARIRFERGAYEEALEDVTRIVAPLPPDLDDDRRILHGNLLLALDRRQEAVATLQGLAAGGATGSFYQNYNLAVALQRVGRDEDSRSLFERLGLQPAADDQQKDVRDRANLSAGLWSLRQQRFQEARRTLERVRLEGPFSNRALLAYGWADAGLADPAGAMTAWAELARRTPDSPESLEGAIATAHEYAATGAYPEALAAYDHASEAIARAGSRLHDLEGTVQSGALLARLTQVNADDELGWLRGAAQIPDMDGSAWLSGILAGLDFQERFKAYRDVRFLEHTLDGWRERLDVLRDMLSNRRAAFASRLSVLDVAARRSKLQDQRQAFTDLHEAVGRSLHDGDGLSLADNRELALQRRLADARSALARVEPDMAARAGERLRRVEGALSWNLQQSFAPRQWTLEKALTDLEAQIDAAQGRIDAIESAAASQPARLEALDRRIDAQQRVLGQLRPTLADLERDLHQDIDKRLLDGIRAREAAVQAYADQARFALAQVRDRAAHGEDAGPTAAGPGEPGGTVEPSGNAAH